MIRGLAALVAASLLAGCEMERRVVAVRGGLHGLPGAVGGEGPPPPAQGPTLANPMGYTAPEGTGPTLRVESPGGDITLVSRNARELAYHLRSTLADNEYDLLYDQLLSTQTKDEYLDRGLDPREAIRFFEAFRLEIARLLSQLQFAERVPMDLGEPIGANRYRLEVPPGTIEPPLRFRRFDYAFERGGARLLLIH